MRFLTNRVRVIGRYLNERARYGTPELVGTVGSEALFVLDGVGRFQIGPLNVRRILREKSDPMATILVDWQFGLIGEIWTDLMWHRRNRLVGAKLARKLLAFRRTHPHTTIHMLAFSGGAGVSLFACEILRGRPLIDTLVLACPAMSPEYNLAPALRAVKRCYALVSRQDYYILGLGTRIFGTTDRRFTPAAGCIGFRRPADLPPEDVSLYARLREITWSPALKQLDHHGGHIGWVTLRFLSRHLLPLLHGDPLLPANEVPPVSPC